MSGSVTGDLGKYGVKFPTAANGVDVNIGTEYRQEKLRLQPGLHLSQRLRLGRQRRIHADRRQLPRQGSTSPRRSVPIVDNMPGIYHLGFEGGYRYSDYTSGFNTNTFKLGLEWAPIQDLKLRGSYNRAVRAPNIGDLYTPAVDRRGRHGRSVLGSEPASTRRDASARKHRRDGSPSTGNILPNPAAQINTTTGGNPNLQPETADTYTVGFVLQPQVAARTSSMSIDYYNIKIKQTISSADVEHGAARSARTRATRSCARLIHRDPKTGSLWFNTNDYIDTNEQNIGTIKTKGIDLAARLHHDHGQHGQAGLHSVTARSDGLQHAAAADHGARMIAPACTAQPAARRPRSGGTLRDRLGDALGGPDDLTARWRYIGPVDVDGFEHESAARRVTYQPGFWPHRRATTTSTSRPPFPRASTSSFRVGVNNITDKDPPIVLNGNLSNCPNSTCNDNTWVGTYDTLGRYMFVHITAKF